MTVQELPAARSGSRVRSAVSRSDPPTACYDSKMEPLTLAYSKGRIYHQATGSSGRIVPIHAFTLDNRMWEPQFEYFSNTYRVINYDDARGYRKSS